MAVAAPFILPADWPAPPRIHALTTLRHGLGGSLAPFDTLNLGNRSSADGDVPAQVERNRALLDDALALPSPPHWLRQVHGVEVARLDAPPAVPAPTDRAGTLPPGVHEPIADAAVTAVPGVVLAILTADCLPVVFVAVDGSEIAAAHAGWRGLADGVLERSVAAMRTPPQQLMAWLGPAAGPQVYEIGEDVFNAFVAHDAQAQHAFVATRPGHWRVDLYALARQRLAHAGVPVGAIHGGGLCTISDPQRFFSHRRDRRSGRMATLAWIAP
ncbi:multi-copper polyphenol oxidoreductase [Xanthomonas nasturtii]|uniref:Purine nucleoside phosphorylase n=1 Tax=Xanthomonas nasturtii TaxID=1843581 RepID=A0A3E1KGS1_9XANT|nr:peptidoglycan editing factor PgeF [Xanthomonas nasturtii]MCL1532246.1 peptidoglycan editing factor PgeF [Xanthomonas nasturtii]MCL1566959.1 peptidoglycan editing factor PgeF [Xanthomonas nasturtii]MCL1570863.1 peptidoglycan editing factor PgeF [Xanthomonas nasturtii]MCL1574655.1 peptidoglycan editing factor PgeF [Xanthomonas nasturtii]MCL1582429.1 peptidoglycan editing factor PgeF [Xanthomonas nasturtii]